MHHSDPPPLDSPLPNTPTFPYTTEAIQTYTDVLTRYLNHYLAVWLKDSPIRRRGDQPLVSGNIVNQAVVETLVTVHAPLLQWLAESEGRQALVALPSTPALRSKCLLLLYLLFLFLLVTGYHASARTFWDTHGQKCFHQWLTWELYRHPLFYPTYAATLRYLPKDLNPYMVLHSSLLGASCFFSDIPSALRFLHFCRTLPSYLPNLLSQTAPVPQNAPLAFLYTVHAILAASPTSHRWWHTFLDHRHDNHTITALQKLLTSSLQDSPHEPVLDVCLIYTLPFLLGTILANILHTRNLCSFILDFLLTHPLGFNVQSTDTSDPIFKLFGPLFNTFCYTLDSPTVDDARLDHLLSRLSAYVQHCSDRWESLEQKDRCHRMVFFVVRVHTWYLDRANKRRHEQQQQQQQQHTSTTRERDRAETMVLQLQSIHGMHPVFSSYAAVLRGWQEVFADTHARESMIARLWDPSRRKGGARTRHVAFVHTFVVPWIPGLADTTLFMLLAVVEDNVADADTHAASHAFFLHALRAHPPSSHASAVVAAVWPFYVAATLTHLSTPQVHALLLHVAPLLDTCSLAWLVDQLAMHRRGPFAQQQAKSAVSALAQDLCVLWTRVAPELMPRVLSTLAPLAQAYPQACLHILHTYGVPWDRKEAVMRAWNTIVDGLVHDTREPLGARLATDVVARL